MGDGSYNTQNILPDDARSYLNALVIDEVHEFSLDILTPPDFGHTYYTGETSITYDKLNRKNIPLSLVFLKQTDSKNQLPYTEMFFVGGGDWVLLGSFTYDMYKDRVVVKGARNFDSSYEGVVYILKDKSLGRSSRS